MICEHYFCTEKAAEILYFTIDGAKAKKYWNVCEEHSGMNIDEVYQVEAIQKLATDNNKTPLNIWNKRDRIGIMTVKL